MADFQVTRAAELLEFAADRFVRYGENPNVDFVLAMRDCAGQLLGQEDRARNVWRHLALIAKNGGVSFTIGLGGVTGKYANG